MYKKAPGAENEEVKKEDNKLDAMKSPVAKKQEKGKKAILYYYI